MKTTRREFLSLIGKGAAAGASLPFLDGCASPPSDGALPFDGAVVGEAHALCHDMRDGLVAVDPVASAEHVYDVIIVGGGASGVAAAWKLLRSGVRNILLVEHGPELGGTSVSGELGGQRFAWAAHYIESPAPGGAPMQEICEDLGIIRDYIDGWPLVDPRYVVAEPEVGLLAGSAWRPVHFPMQVAESRDVVEYERFRQDMYRWVTWRDSAGRPAFGRPIGRTSPSDEARDLDHITMAAYLDRLGIESDLVRWYVNNRVVDEYGCGIEDASAWAGVQFWAQSNSSFTDFEPPGTPSPAVLSWPEGNSFLVNGMARDLTPSQKRLRSLVVNVRNASDRALVTCLDDTGSERTTLQAKAVIYAAPKHAIYYVIPDLVGAGRDEFNACKYIPWVTAAGHVRRPPATDPRHPLTWETLGHEAWGLGYIDNRHMTRRDDGFDTPTVLTFYAALCEDIDEDRRTLLNEGWDYWARAILGALQQMHPGIESLITRLDVRKWGHAMIAMRPGYLWGPERRRMLRPFGRVHFAGVDIAGTPVFEQAAHRGVEAAEAAMATLGASYSSSLS
ncbi:FAD-dependent oxidoreductase [Candidatus Poribacteria bacterium]|nr:FAD-dependent oxidoreductase [Candidatus Poribacteria bacterium]